MKNSMYGLRDVFMYAGQDISNEMDINSDYST